MFVERLGHGGRAGPHRAPVVAAVGMKLQVRQVRPPPFQHLHRLDRRGDVAGDAEVVAVQVQRMRQLQVVHDLREAGNDLRGRQGRVALERLVQLRSRSCPTSTPPRRQDSPP